MFCQQELKDKFLPLTPFHKKYDPDVGWVEGRNPTPQSQLEPGRIEFAATQTKPTDLG